MSKPRDAFNPPDFSGQSKIMFYNEGNPAAMLVMNKGGRRQISTMEFPKAEVALAWCRQRGVILVYIPVNLDRN